MAVRPRVEREPEPRTIELFWNKRRETLKEKSRPQDSSALCIWGGTAEVMNQQGGTTAVPEPHKIIRSEPIGR